MELNKRYHIWLLLGLILSQWFIFNLIEIPNNIQVLVYCVYFLFLPPLPIIGTYILFFLVGILMDISMESPGVNLIACTVVVPFRLWLLEKNISIHDNRIKKGTPARTMRKGQLAFFVIFLSLIFNTAWYLAINFDFSNFGWLLLRILSSTLITLGTFFLLYQGYLRYCKKRK